MQLNGMLLNAKTQPNHTHYDRLDFKGCDMVLPLVIEKQKETKNIAILAGAFVVVFGLYFFLDVLAHNNLTTLINELGIPLLLVHQSLNIVLAGLTSVMISFSQINLSLTKKEPMGSNAIPFFSFIFGLLTFGCAPCVITFLAAVGIAFTPIVFPMGNLLWKVILLGLILLGFIWIMISIHKTTCKPKTMK